MDAPDPQVQDQQAEQPEKTNGKDTTKTEATRPVTVLLAEDLVRKLKVIAVMRDASISTVIEGYVAKAVKADIKKAIGKLDV